MTTAVTRPLTVTTRIGAPTGPAAPDVFTATVYVNTAPDSFDGFEPHHPLTAATHRDGTLLRLVFHASDRIRDHEDAADAAFVVGNYQGADDNAQTWPDNIRTVSVGDVITVTGPDTRTVTLSVDSYGCSPVPAPATP
ncbi:hypothetical protein OG458_42310 (plasmid) [Streptomyces sp. NBC_01281]|uniref:hypothetical protein n=1 Tax=Streptomyces sp. NBC_01281 TaxID=2903811 RepID=UPI002E111C40|nr:hypothetical protein OG458_41495 [Streptomyces sp. NBC_01281]WSK66591.1 hypothetical protein OG458_42310 [Streptomyces sp. NBC_01281]